MKRRRGQGTRVRGACALLAASVHLVVGSQRAMSRHLSGCVAAAMRQALVPARPSLLGSSLRAAAARGCPSPLPATSAKRTVARAGPQSYPQSYSHVSLRPATPAANRMHLVALEVDQGMTKSARRFFGSDARGTRGPENRIQSHEDVRREQWFRESGFRWRGNEAGGGGEGRGKRGWQGKPAMLAAGCISVAGSAVAWSLVCGMQGTFSAGVRTHSSAKLSVLYVRTSVPQFGSISRSAPPPRWRTCSRVCVCVCTRR